ncbi:MAG: trypsin-like peptidase domain-containing protein [Gemmatimonadota bacterium]
MSDPLRSKLNLILAATLAFALGMGATSALDLTPASFAAGGRTSLELKASPGLEGVDVSTGFGQIVDRIQPAVVTIAVEQEPSRRTGRGGRPELPSPFDRFFERPSGQEPPPEMVSGSGFVISTDGYIVTNNHVVEGAAKVTVRLNDGRQLSDVEVVGTDPTTDVALVKIDAGGLTAAPLGYSDSTHVGDWVLAIGSPGFSGAGQILPGTVTAGIVSAKGRNIGILGQRLMERTGSLVNPAIEDFIQTDAVINPGNSGGPLVNARAEVVGVNTAIFSTTGRYQGYGFAIPIELVREVVDDLIEYGEVRRAVIGVTVSEVDSYDAEYYGLDRVAGAKVNDVGPEDEPSPAARAGIEPGDIILSVDGQPVEAVGDLQRKIRAHEPGETVTLEIVKRSTKRRERVKVTLAAAEQPDRRRENRTVATAPSDPLGLEVETLTEDIRRQLDLPSDVKGVVIGNVSTHSPLYRQVGPGMIISDVNGQEVDSSAEYRSTVTGLHPGDVANLLVFSPRARRYTVVSVPVPEH